MEPKVILVDLNDKPLGEMAKSQAHAIPKLHRAFSVFLYHDNKLLIQQRALDKYHSGGLWANTCCSHPRPGEELLESAKSRLLEEAGVSMSHLEHLFEFTYMAQFAENLYEYEYDHVFLGEYQGEFTPNPSEVEKMLWVDISWLSQDMLENPRKYAPWFLNCAPKVMRIIHKRTQ